MTKKITLMDGAVGTTLWELADARGIKREPVWKYNMEHPELVTQLAKEYADAGAEIILANTMAANRPAVEGASEYDPAEVVRRGVKLVKEALEGNSAKTCLAIGPLSTLLEPLGPLKKKDAEMYFGEMIDAGMEEKPDYIYLQTFLDLEMMKLAVKQAVKYNVPVFATMTFEKHGKTLMGNTVEKIIKELVPLGISGIGMNCSLGPELSMPIIKQFAENTDMPIVFKPNAGMPAVQDDGTMKVETTAEEFADEIEPALEFVDYVGGCCNCNADFVRTLGKKIKNIG